MTRVWKVYKPLWRRWIDRLLRRGRWLFPLLAITALVSTGCDRLNQRRVTVFYPEHWAPGEYRICNLKPGTPPELDCDMNSRETPVYHLFTMDVEFDGTSTKEATDDWTCQSLNSALVCKR